MLLSPRPWAKLRHLAFRPALSPLTCTEMSDSVLLVTRPSGNGCRRAFTSSSISDAEDENAEAASAGSGRTVSEEEDGVAGGLLPDAGEEDLPPALLLERVACRCL